MLLKIYIIITILTISLLITDYVIDPKDFQDKENKEDTGKGFLIFIIAFALLPILNILLFIGTIILVGTTIKDKKNNKIKVKKEKYVNLINKLDNFVEYHFQYYKVEDIGKSINHILSNYKIILDNDFHKDLAYSRLEYLLTFLEECIKNKMIKDDEIIKEIRAMAESLSGLMQGLVDDINDINNKANAELKEYLKSKTKEYIDNTNQMIKDFKEYNK